MRLSTIVPLIVAFGGAAAGALIAASASVGALERSSARGVDFQLRVEGHDWANVQADGLQVVISGEAPSEAERFKALSVAGGIVDAARIIDDMSVTDTDAVVAPRFTVEILRNDAGISLIGLIPTETDRDAVLARIARVADGKDVTDLLETADYATPARWPEALDYGLDALAELPRSKISVSADRVEITAAADSETDRARLEAELSRAAPDAVTAAVRISAPRPVITPFTLRFLIDEDGARFDSCSADTDGALDTILTAAVEAGFQEKSNCRLGLGTPTTRWGEAAAAGIAAVNALGAGSVTFNDMQVSLVATMDTDEAVFDTVAADLEAALPDLFSLTAVLPEPVVTTEAGPPGFAATKSPEGQVQMRGHVGDALAVTAVQTYGKSRFGADQSYLAAEPHPDLPQGWSLRVLAGLSALSELDYGSLEVTAESVSVRGDTGNPDARARVAQTLSEELGEGEDFAIAVVYREELDPMASIPTPEECLADIIEITTAKKLTFEPGSTDLDAESLETIGAVVAVLSGCPEFEIVVEGHTDSQGREEMNLALSQQRAEAVVTAIRGKRLAWPGIYPQGFGEAEPIASNDTEEGREANRRIEFRMVSLDEGAPAAEDGGADETTAQEGEAAGE
ncbi:MAG: OmpA family protein [Pseudomonadota bacterium]